MSKAWFFDWVDYIDVDLIWFWLVGFVSSIGGWSFFSDRVAGRNGKVEFGSIASVGDTVMTLPLTSRILIVTGQMELRCGFRELLLL